MALDDEQLEQLMDKAGIREGAKQKLRSANRKPAEGPSDDPTPSRPRGHGPASQTRPVIDDL